MLQLTGWYKHNIQCQTDSLLSVKAKGGLSSMVLFTSLMGDESVWSVCDDATCAFLQS